MAQWFAGVSFAGADPFFDLSRGGFDPRFWGLEAVEFFFWEQKILAVVGKEHAVFADEEAAVAPLWNAAVVPDFWFFLLLLVQ